MLIRFSSTFPFCRLREGGKRKEESACTAPREREGIFNSPGIVKRRLIMPLLLASRVIKLGIILAPELISKLVLFRDEMPIKFLGREVGKKIVYSSLGVEINFKKEPAKRNQIFFPINVYPTCYNVIELRETVPILPLITLKLQPRRPLSKEKSLTLAYIIFILNITRIPPGTESKFLPRALLNLAPLLTKDIIEKWNDNIKYRKQNSSFVCYPLIFVTILIIGNGDG